MPTPTTPNRGYQMPHEANLLDQDVLRLKSALTAIDTDMDAVMDAATALTSRVTTAEGEIDALQAGAVMTTGDQLIAGEKTFSTSPIVPSPSGGDSSFKAATTAFVMAAIGAAIPAGVMLPYAGSSAPSGFLLCAGQAVSRSTYSALFAAIGTTFGAGNGSTTFNVPDLRGRVAGGKDDMGGSAANRLTTSGSGVDGITLGAAGGAETHTLTTPQLPAHTHALNAQTLSGRNTSSGGGETIMYAGSGFNTNQAGSGAAHNNTQPTLVTNYIIKAV